MVSGFTRIFWKISFKGDIFKKDLVLTETKFGSEKSEMENWGALLMRHGYVGRLVSRETSSFGIFVLTETKSSREKCKTGNRGALLMRYQDW